MKRILIFSIFFIFLFSLSCNKEDAILPSADFTTNLQNNNTLQKGKSFTVYLNNVQGDFFVYFRGNNEQSTYSGEDPTRVGTTFSNELDSLVIPAYNNIGDKTFTVIASSSGNWSKDYLMDIKSITITVVD